MDNRIIGILDVLRKVTTTVKLAPFIVAVFYMITILGYMYMPDEVITMLDTLLYFSPVSVAVLIILSNQLHLCVWHRFECVIPLLCMIPSVIDWFVIQLSEVATYINAIVLSVILLASLVNAYFVFIKPTVRKE
mgnify:CR=1 FL=1